MVLSRSIKSQMARVFFNSFCALNCVLTVHMAINVKNLHAYLTMPSWSLEHKSDMGDLSALHLKFLFFLFLIVCLVRAWCSGGLPESAPSQPPAPEGQKKGLPEPKQPHIHQPGGVCHGKTCPHIKKKKKKDTHKDGKCFAQPVTLCTWHVLHAPLIIRNVLWLELGHCVSSLKIDTRLLGEIWTL